METQISAFRTLEIKAAAHQNAVQFQGGTMPTSAPQAAGWFFKSEASVYSVADLKRERRCRWDGVRNYQARNFLRQAHVGDPVAIWHSNAKQPGVAGLGKVLKAAYPDPTAFDKKHSAYDEKSDPDNPRWFSVDVGFVKELPQVIPAKQLREDPA